ncbi:hypothetical protein [Flavobacterium davisii]|uniref:Lipoprotein n=1 Tax=Flavobacterium columnare TaxID=996 RepID=A0A8G0P5U4_9FLAO|nr:hypothetical protein [Flavobacterium davisii]QYS89386.1 hypothetical protein JJC05_03415 [Flavobacterium davisii]
MRKTILLLSVSLLLSCSKDKELTDLKLDNDVKNNVDVAPLVDPTENELRKYFDIEITQDIDKAANNISTIRETKKIESKELSIEEAIIETKDVDKGIITVKVSGKFGKKNFSKKQYTFFDFAQKPYDSYMVNRAYMRWKPQFKDNPAQLTDIDFDTFYRLKKTDLLTIEELSKWVDLYSSNPNANIYKYTAEDLKNTKIIEALYTDEAFNFRIKYKNETSKYISLHFNKNEYYKKKVVLDKEEIKKYYVQGVHQEFSGFFGNLVKISDDFNLELMYDNANLNKSENSISCHFSLSTKKDEKLAEFEYLFTGFKPLSDLSKELVIKTTNELDQYMQRSLLKTPDGDVIEKVKRSLQHWIKMTQIGVIRKDDMINTIGENSIIRLPNNQLALKLYLKSISLGNYSVDALVPLSRRGLHQDILLINPYFQVNSAVKKEGKLIVEVELYNVNEESLNNVKRQIEIRL